MTKKTLKMRLNLGADLTIVEVKVVRKPNGLLKRMAEVKISRKGVRGAKGKIHANFHTLKADWDDYSGRLNRIEMEYLKNGRQKVMNAIIRKLGEKQRRKKCPKS